MRSFIFKKRVFQLVLIFLLVTPVLSFIAVAAVTREDTPGPGQGVNAGEKLEKTTEKTIGAFRALMIGISDYKDEKISDIETAVNDVKKLSDTLESLYGFKDVILLLDNEASLSNILKAFRHLVQQSGEDDSVLIYYAGHGVVDEETGNGWWLPYNTTWGDPSTYIENKVVRDYLKTVLARHVLVIADSYFSNRLFGETRPLPEMVTDMWYATIYKNRSRWGMTSGNLMPKAGIASEGHSVFAYQFLQTLKKNRDPFLTPREIYAEIESAIINNSRHEPVIRPIKNVDDQGGEFIFIRTTSVGAELLGSEEGKDEVSLDELEEKFQSLRKKQLKIEKRRLDDLREEEHLAKMRAERGPVRKQQKKEKLLPSKIKSMVFIEGGCFDMGDTFGDGEPDEKPVHEVCVNDFYLDAHEVTQGEWRAVMGNNPSYFKGFFKNCGPNCPVEKVSWVDAQTFIKKLNDDSGMTYRLPTEAEWEYAARVGATKEKWSGTSNEGELGEYAWYKENFEGKPSPVGKKKPNAFGLFDMSGNVWEWVQDRYYKYYYRKSPHKNPQGPSEGSFRLVRGGSWASSKNDLRTTNRKDHDQFHRNSDLGFRLAREAVGPD